MDRYKRDIRTCAKLVDVYVQDNGVHAADTGVCACAYGIRGYGLGCRS
jgi:hypothetical protein